MRVPVSAFRALLLTLLRLMLVGVATGPGGAVWAQMAQTAQTAQTAQSAQSAQAAQAIQKIAEKQTAGTARLEAAIAAVAAPASSSLPALKPERVYPDSDVFGSQIFRGQFAARSFTGFNPDYRITTGDRITLRLWGAFTLDTSQVVDAQGNVFISNLGPVRVQGVRNAELNDLLQQQIKRVFRANVQSYASLEAAQPVKLYVTGFVRQPGLYNGLSSDSVLHYLDQAGGIDPDRGSYLAVDLLRGGKLRTRIDLYQFLLAGQMEPLQLHDGDTVFVAPRKFSVRVRGEVANANVFEMATARISATDLLTLARPKPTVTHLAIARQVGAERRSEYFPIGALANVQIADGDDVSFMADTVSGTLQVRVEGAHRGQRTLILPYGSRLKDVLSQVKLANPAQLGSLQLYRKSIAVRQKELLTASLDKLETQALTARSATNEEANLRTREAELVLQFTARARSVETKGRLVFPRLETAGETLLEDGDILFIPEESSQVSVNGEVMFPVALNVESHRTVADYILLAGGYTQNADTSRVLLIRRNGAVVEVKSDARPEPGEELMILPKADTRNIEVARGITQILYQLAIAAKVLIGL